MQISFFVFVHAVFEEVISIILSHGSKFFTYQADVFFVPVGFCEAIKEYCSKFLENDIESVVVPFISVNKSKCFLSGIVRIEEKSIVSLVGTIVKEFLEHTLFCIH